MVAIRFIVDLTLDQAKRVPVKDIEVFIKEDCDVFCVKFLTNGITI
jgi:hypothetical protein